MEHRLLPTLSQLLAQCYKDGFVPPEVAAVISLTLPNVSWLGLSLPYEGNVVTVNNLAESGAPHMACLPAADTAASVAIRNAVPCISSTPTYEDVVAAFDAKHQCGVVITIPIGSRPSHALTPSGVRTQSGPAIAALSVGYAAGQPVSEADLLTASNLAARMSPYVNVLLASFLPELMRDCACHADDACAPGAGVGAGDGNEPPGAGTSCTVNNKRAELPPLECLEPLLMLDTVRRNGRSSLSSRRPSSNNTVVLHPLWTAAWFNMRQHGRPMTSQLASSMLQSLTLNDNEKIGDHGRGLDAEDVLAPRQGAAVGQPNDLAGALRQAMASTNGAQHDDAAALQAPLAGDADIDMTCSASSASAGDACRMEVLLPAGSSVVAL